MTINRPEIAAAKEPIETENDAAIRRLPSGALEYPSSVDRTFRNWHDAGRPGSDNPVTQKLADAIKSHAEKDTHDFLYKAKPNRLLPEREINGREFVDEDRLTARKIDRAIKALKTYDPNHAKGAAFSTYLLKPFSQENVDELRRATSTPFNKQARQRLKTVLDELLEAQGKGTSRDPETYTDADSFIAREFPGYLKELGHWAIRQPHKPTWRDVASEFSEFGSEDKAQRALKSVKKLLKQWNVAKGERWR